MLFNPPLNFFRCEGILISIGSCPPAHSGKQLNENVQTLEYASEKKDFRKRLPRGLIDGDQIEDHRPLQQRRFGTGDVTMPCMFTHQWKIVLKTRLAHKTRLAYRTCRRCGLMQRGIYDGLYQDIVWESTRERTFIRSQQVRIVRQPLSLVEQIAHFLRLRRTRMTDRNDHKNARR